jgi:DNA repair exonuclease SbcCD nuclease subunit
MASVDIIILAGDVFDTSLYFSDDAVGEIELWMLRLLRLCSKWDITLLILEGTPSHDRKQSKHFIKLQQSVGIDVDVHYIDTLTIEYFPKFNVNILFVPDEYHSTTLETWLAVQELLLMHNLEKVDYAVMHGMFHHQMQTGLQLPFHDSQNYLSIVKKYIFIGHIHQMSVYERILSHGSTDRLCHGDESDKGMWRVESHRDSFDSDKLEFVINKGAKKFITISWIGLESDAIHQSMRFLEMLEPDSHVRIELQSDPAILGLWESYKRTFPLLRWTHKVIKDTNTHDVSVKLTTFQPIPINPNTIESIVAERLVYLNIAEDRRERILSLLQKVK